MSEKKNVVKNYIYNLIYQILILVVPLITTPYLSKVLGAENIGIYSYTLSIVTYFVLFGSLGIAMYGQREIAYNQEDKHKRSKIFFELNVMRLFTFVIAILVYFLIFCIDNRYSLYYKILLLEILANIVDISWFFQGLEEFKKTVIRNTIVKIISVICIFTFVKNSNDLIIYFVIYTLSTLIGNLSLWLYLPKYLVKVKIKELNIFSHLKPTIALFIPQIAIQVYTLLDKTMIGKILNDMSQVGNYEQSQKIIKIALTIVTALGTVLAPRIANNLANDNKEEVEKYLRNSINFVLFIGTPIMFGIMAISTTLVPWFLGEEYEISKLLLIIGAPLILSIGLNNVTGVQYLIQAKKQNIFTKTVVIGAICNFLINLLLIPYIKSVGAIIASVLAETIILIFQLIYIRKDFALKSMFKMSFLKYIFSGLLMFIITFGISYILPTKVFTTIIQIAIGVITYFGVLLILRDEYLFKIINMLKQKLIRSNG